MKQETTISNNNKVYIKKEDDSTISSSVNLNDESTWTYPLTKQQLDILRSRIISSDEYFMLSDEEKQKYIKFSPASDKLRSLLRMLQEYGVFAQLLGPVFEVLNNLPNPNPLQQLVTIMEAVNKFFDALSTIKSIKDVPIVGTLATPIIDFILALWDILISVFLLIIALFDGKLAAVLKLKENWPKIKEAFNDLTDPDDIFAEAENIDWKEFESYLGEDWVELQKTFFALQKPIYELMDTFKKIGESLKATSEIFERLDPMGEKSPWAKLLQFMTGRTPTEMLQGSKELEKMLKAPLALFREISDGIGSLAEYKYALKDDFYKFSEHKKAIKEKEKIEELKNKQINDHSSILNITVPNKITNEKATISNNITNIDRA